MQDAKLMAQYDHSLLAGFLAFSRWMIIAISQIPEHFPELQDWLKMARISALPYGPSVLIVNFLGKRGKVDTFF